MQSRAKRRLGSAGLAVPFACAVAAASVLAFAAGDGMAAQESRYPVIGVGAPYKPEYGFAQALCDVINRNRKGRLNVCGVKDGLGDVEEKLVHLAKTSINLTPLRLDEIVALKEARKGQDPHARTLVRFYDEPIALFGNKLSGDAEGSALAALREKADGSTVVVQVAVSSEYAGFTALLKQALEGLVARSRDATLKIRVERYPLQNVLPGLCVQKPELLAVHGQEFLRNTAILGKACGYSLVRFSEDELKGLAVGANGGLSTVILQDDVIRALAGIRAKSQEDLTTISLPWFLVARPMEDGAFVQSVVDILAAKKFETAKTGRSLSFTPASNLLRSDLFPDNPPLPYHPVVEKMRATLQSN